MLDAIERPLTDSERSDLAARLQGARAESAQALLKTGASSALVCGGLGLVTLWLSDAPALVIVGFWSVMGLVLALWIGLPWRRLMQGQVRILEDGLRTNRARDLPLRSDRVVEFEEEEDEGACYAFEHRGGSATVFIVGQEFYEDDDFPNSDFSLVEILGGNGNPVDVLVVKRGRKLSPERVIPPHVKNQFDLPEHLEVIDAPLERIESALRRRT